MGLKQNEVLNIIQAKKCPEVPTFWRLFYRPNWMAKVSYLLSHLNAFWIIYVYNRRRLQSVGRFRERFIPKQPLSIFKVVIFKWNLTIIVLITKERWIMVCFSVIETQRKLQRSTQAAQRSTSLLGIWNVSNYIYSKVWPRNFLEDCLSQNRADCASEDCLSHR